MSLLPKWRVSLFGQMAVLIAFALIVAQVLGYFLLLDQQQRASLVAASGPALTHFAETARQVAQAEGDPIAANAILERRSNFEQRYWLSPTAPLGGARPVEIAERLSRALERSGVRSDAVSVAMRRGAGPPRRGPPPGLALQDRRPLPPGGVVGESTSRPLPAKAGRRPGDEPMRFATFSAQLSSGVWLNAEARWYEQTRDFLPRVIGAEAILFLAILMAALLVARRIAQPLDVLSQAAAQVGAPSAPPLIASAGPSEIRAVIDAFNAMSQRVSALLTEKDELIGAIAHDLRTPLASLRIRAESVADKAEREKIIQTLDEMSQLVDDSLDMARLGRSLEPQRLVDASALSESLVEDYISHGQPVTFLDSHRSPITCRPALLRRLLRNLIDNAVKFGSRAEVRVETKEHATMIIVSDRGPGLSATDIDRVLQPFARGETSRSRDTGGAGLGLAIAARIASLESAELRLSNGDEGGLRAEVVYARAS